MTPRSFPAPLASVRTPKPLSCASPSQPAFLSPPCPVPCSFVFCLPRTPGSSSESCSTQNSLFSIVHYQFVALPHGVRARSIRSQRCKSCTFASRCLASLAAVDGSADSGSHDSTAICAQPFPALCPCRGWLPCWLSAEPAPSRQS